MPSRPVAFPVFPSLELRIAMQRIVVLLLALVALGGAAFFFLNSGGELPDGAAGGDAQLEKASAEDASDDLRARSGGAPDDGAGQATDGGAREERTEAAKGPQTTIVGRVLTAKGAAVAGAEVALRMAPHFPVDGVVRIRNRDMPGASASWKGSTDAQGRFALRVPAPLEAKRLQVRAPRMVTIDYELARADGAEEALAQGGELALGDLRMDVGIVLQGRVVDAFGAPVRGSAISYKPKRGADGAFVQLIESIGSDGASKGATQTDADGRFELVIEKVGAYVVQATHDEHAPGAIDVELDTLGETRSGLLIRFAASGEIRGVVRGFDEAAGDVEIRAVKVDPDKADSIFASIGSTLAWAKKRADVAEGGSFRLAGLERGAEYRLAAFTKSEQAFGRVQVSRATMAMCGQRGVQLAYRPGVVVVFDAVSARTGEKLEQVRGRTKLEAPDGGVDVAGMLVNLRAGNKVLERGPDGRFRLEPLRPDDSSKTLAVTVQVEGHRRFEKRGIALPRAGIVDLGVLRFDEAPTLSVRVVDASGKAVEGAKVRFEKASRAASRSGARAVRRTVSVTADASNSGVATGFHSASGPFSQTRVPVDKTDENGLAELSLTSYLEGRVIVEHADFADTRSEILSVAARGDTEHRVQLSAGGEILVSALDVDGKALEGAKLRCEARGALAEAGTHDAETSVSDAEGVARFRALPPGLYDVFFEPEERSPLGNMSIRVSSEGGDSQPEFRGERADVVDGRTTRVTLRKLPSVTLRGVVTLDGKPLAGARVRLDKGNAGLEDMLAGMEGALGGIFGAAGKARVKTGSDGKYELEGIQVGRRKIAVSHPQLMMPHRAELDVTVGTTRFDIAIRLTSLAGIVVDEAGDPVAGAVVSVERAGMSETARAMQTGRMMIATVDGQGGGRIAGTRGATTRVTVETGADGRFTLPGVASGEDMVVVVRPEKHAEIRSEVLRLREGEKREGLRLVAQLGGTIEITVDPKNAGLGLVTLRPAGAEGPEGLRTARLEKGRAVVEGLAKGVWKVSLVKMGGAPAEKEVTVVPGKTVPCLF